MLEDLIQENDFNRWNLQKQKIHARGSIFCNPREIWWCSLGMNIGSEQNGRNEIFERPVLITKVFSKETCRIIPMTSKIKEDEHHMSISYERIKSTLILSQMKTISTKRLSRKIGRLDEETFKKVFMRTKSSL